MVLDVLTVSNLEAGDRDSGLEGGIPELWEF